MLDTLFGITSSIYISGAPLYLLILTCVLSLAQGPAGHPTLGMAGYLLGYTILTIFVVDFFDGAEAEGVGYAFYTLYHLLMSALLVVVGIKILHRHRPHLIKSIASATLMSGLYFMLALGMELESLMGTNKSDLRGMIFAIQVLDMGMRVSLLVGILAVMAKMRKQAMKQA